MEALYDLLVDVAFVRTETACESFWDVKELVDYGLLFSFFGKPVVSFGNDFDDVRWWEVQGFLPYFAKPVDSGDSAL
jgi:hypothetical protein